MILDNDVTNILFYAIENGDNKSLLDTLVENNISKEHLDSFYIKLGEYLPVFTDHFPEKEYFLENVLLISSELVQTFGINSDGLALKFAYSMLSLIIDENSNISILKRAVHIFNLLIQNQDILCPLVEDESYEGSLQILGRKVSTIGDYEGQALLFEVLYRITSLANREYWANVWFPDEESRDLFLNLDPQKFESDCRKALNHLNRTETDRRVFSFVANSVSFGSLQLKELNECEFWIDFNYDSQSISFYCSELAFEVPGTKEDERGETSAMWETILISNDYIKAYLVKDWKKEKKTEILLILNIPCYSIINENNGTNPALDSYEVRILFWEIQNMRHHLEIIYGKDKYAGEELEVSELKVSASSEIIGIISEERNGYMDDDLSQKKVSTLSAPLPLGVWETEEDFIPASDHNQKYSVIRRSSAPAEMIPFTTEDFPTDHRGQFYRKISESCEVIQFETLQDGECVEKKTKRSLSIDAAFYDENSNYEDIGGKDEETSSSSLENNSHEKNQKAHLKKVRLYNPDTAPVYDVPRRNNSSDPSEENTSLKKDQLVSNGQEDVFESRVEESELKQKQVVKKSPPRKKSKSAKTTDEDKKLRHYNFDSEEEFQDLPLWSSGKRKERKNSATNSTTSKKNSYKRKYEDVLSDDSSRVKNREQVKTTSAGNKKEFHKRKYEDVLSDDSQSEKDKMRVKRPRKAAVKGRRKTRQMFKTKPIPYDEIEILSDDSSELLTEKVSKKKKLKKNTSESDTFSSEVSWMKPKQRPKLFESPKRNYLERRSSIRKKRELPVEIFPGSKSTSKKPPSKKKNNSSNLSDFKPRSLNLSDFENYSLTIEKCTKNTYTIMKNLESDFQSISTSNLGRNSIERNSQTHSKCNSHDSDIDSKPKSDQELKRTVEVKGTDNGENCEKRGMSRVSSATNVKKADVASKSSNSLERISSDVQKLRSLSNDNYDSEDLICSKAHSEIDVNSLPQSSHKELDQKEKEDECEKILPKHTVESASGEYENEPQNISSDKVLENADNICKDGYQRIEPTHDLKTRTSKENGYESKRIQQYTENSDELLVGEEFSPEPSNDFTKEKEGKKFILKRYIEACTAYSDAVNSSRTTLLENESNSHKNSSYLSNRASSIGLKSSQESCTKENDESSLEHQEYHHDNNYYIEKACNKIKNKLIRTSILFSKGKKRKKLSSDHIDENKKSPETGYLSKKAHSLPSRPTANSVIDSTSCENLRSQKLIRKAADEKLIALSEEFDKYERPMKKQKKIKKLKDNHDNSFHSMHSKLTSSSFNLEKDKEWFQSLTVVLSENASSLSKRLLGTVQKCFLDFSMTMKALRENLIKTVEVFEIPSSKMISSYKLKNLVKSCKTARIEMENSLRRMQISGNEYFQAEERLNRKLRKKNLKASKKFISSMKYVERNTTKQLENKIISKTRSYLKKCLKHIESV